MSKNDLVDLQEAYDANAAYLRDSMKHGKCDAVVKAEINLKMLDIELAVEQEES
jgi:hypothetical protein